MELKYSNCKQDLTMLTAYLLGMKVGSCGFDKYFGQSDSKIFNSFNKNTDLRVIRTLCKVRMVLLKHWKSITSMPSASIVVSCTKFSIADIDWLKSQGIDLSSKSKIRNIFYKQVSELINNSLYKLKESKYLPKWLPINDYLYLFRSDDSISYVAKAREYCSNKTKYPYQLYLNVDIKRYSYNILKDDRVLVNLITAGNADNYAEYIMNNVNKPKVSKTGVSSIGVSSPKVEENPSSDIVSGEAQVLDFMDTNDSNIIVVDCENTRLGTAVALVKAIKNKDRIKKILLIDDESTLDDWSILSNYTDIDIDYTLIKRVAEKKSNVDMKLTLCTYKEVMLGVKGIVLLSSDSDYLCMIDTIREEVPSVKFLVVYKEAITGASYLSALSKRGIPTVRTLNFKYVNIQMDRANLVLDKVVNDLNSRKINVSGLLSSRKGTSIEPVLLRALQGRISCNIDNDGSCTFKYENRGD